MIYAIKGDLLKSDCNIIAHQCNGYGKMGAGIAKQIKSLYPAAYDVNQQYTIPVRDPQYRYGKGKQTDYHALERSLKNMFWVIDNRLDLQNIKIGMPYKIGCSLAGGDWTLVEKMLKDLSGEYKRAIYLYQL